MASCAQSKFLGQKLFDLSGLFFHPIWNLLEVHSFTHSVAGPIGSGQLHELGDLPVPGLEVEWADEEGRKGDDEQQLLAGSFPGIQAGSVIAVLQWVPGKNNNNVDKANE